MATRTKLTRGQQLQQAITYPIDWLEERSGLVGGVKYFLFRKVPGDINWFQTLGSATLTAFLVQALTGSILAMYYKPDPKNAYASIQNITNDLFAGWLVRGMHRWGASVFIILMFMHMGRVFLFGAYKYPRELNWILGVLLLTMGLAEGFTGYLLPWDQTAYWATIVGVNINGTGADHRPLPGAVPARRHRDRRRHALALLRDPHAADPRADLRADRAAPVPRRPARRHVAAVVEGSRRHRPARQQRLAERQALRPDAQPQAGTLMASDRIVERRRIFQQYKEDVKERGKPFFPYAMWHDTIMSFVVVVVIIGLAIVWKYSTPGNHHTGEAGWLGKLYDAPADPGTINFVPRPDWYFYFLFYLLRIFKWPHVGDPRHDRDPDDRARPAARDPVHRHPRRSGGCSRRPVAIDRVDPRRHLDGRPHLQGRDGEGVARLGADRRRCPTWAKKQGFTEQPAGGGGREALRGRRLSQLPHVPRRRRRLSLARRI